VIQRIYTDYRAKLTNPSQDGELLSQIVYGMMR